MSLVELQQKQITKITLAVRLAIEACRRTKCIGGHPSKVEICKCTTSLAALFTGEPTVGF
jgi:hypothetical protein